MGSGELMLLDSGSCKCIEPASPGLRASGTVDTSYKLTTASGKPLICYGEKQRTIELGGGLKVTHTFLIAEVSKVILGSDLMKRFGFSVDFFRNRFTYHPGAIDESFTPFANYHCVVGEVHGIQPQELENKIQIGKWSSPKGASLKFTDGASGSKAKEQQQWHPAYIDFF